MTRYPLGEVVDLMCVTNNASGVPTKPDKAPIYQIYDDLGAPIASGRMPTCDYKNIDGLFATPLFLGETFAAGRYNVVYEWMISGNVFGSMDSFEVLQIGNNQGPGVTMTTMNLPTGQNPAVTYGLMYMRSGNIKKQKNPRAL